MGIRSETNASLSSSLLARSIRDTPESQEAKLGEPPPQTALCHIVLLLAELHARAIFDQGAASAITSPSTPANFFAAPIAYTSSNPRIFSRRNADPVGSRFFERLVFLLRPGG